MEYPKETLRTKINREILCSQDNAYIIFIEKLRNINPNEFNAFIETTKTLIKESLGSFPMGESSVGNWIWEYAEKEKNFEPFYGKLDQEGYHDYDPLQFTKNWIKRRERELEQILKYINEEKFKVKISRNTNPQDKVYRLKFKRHKKDNDRRIIINSLYNLLFKNFLNSNVSEKDFSKWFDKENKEKLNPIHLNMTSGQSRICLLFKILIYEPKNVRTREIKDEFYLLKGKSILDSKDVWKTLEQMFLFGEERIKPYSASSNAESAAKKEEYLKEFEAFIKDLNIRLSRGQ